MNRTSQILAVVLLAVVSPGLLMGQDALADPPPPEGALFLLLPVGAEGVSLGRAMTAARSAESAFWNPAGLAGLTRTEFLVMRGASLLDLLLQQSTVDL